jgi:hypothetical protein
MRPRPSAWARSTTARPSLRSARRACCLPPTMPICRIPKARCMPSATRCRTWHQMGVILSATDSLNWYAKLVGADAAETLTNALGERWRPVGRHFLPYLSAASARRTTTRRSAASLPAWATKATRRRADAIGPRRRLFRLPRLPGSVARSGNDAGSRHGGRRRIALGLLAEADGDRARTCRSRCRPTAISAPPSARPGLA